MAKHVLVISQYFYPEQFRINDIAMEWVKRGHKVTVLTGIPNYPQGKFYDGYNWWKKRKEYWNGIEIIRIPLLPRGRTSIGMILNYFSFVVSGFFWSHFTNLKADLVFTFEVSPMTQALLGVWYSKRRKISNYLYVQDLWPENVEVVTGIHNKIIIGAIGKMVDYIYKHCDKIFATSPSFVKSIQKRVKGQKENVIYWPQYAEEFYRPSKFISEEIPQDDYLNITFTGNIGTAQGLEILPNTARILKELNLKVRFNIVGDGRNKENLIDMINEKAVEDCFNIIGWKSAESIPSILAASDAAFLSFANNSLYSMTIPAKVQSYMACACPIVGAVEGESKRIIEEAGCGFVAEIGSAESLADVICRFIKTTTEDRLLMGLRAKEYCDRNFDKEALITLLDKQYIHIE